MTKVVVKKKSPLTSLQDLVKALDRFMELLESQGENEAVEDLKRASNLMIKEGSNAQKLKDGLEMVKDCFEGDHELSAYTIAREKKLTDWTEAEQLYMASTQVLSLTQRLLKSL